MIQYLVTIETGGSPLTYRVDTIYKALETVMKYARTPVGNHLDEYEAEALMQSLADMRAGKTLMTCFGAACVELLFDGQKVAQ